MEMSTTVVKMECLHWVSSRGGPSSETGSRTCEGERKEQCEAAGTQVKGGDTLLHWHLIYDSTGSGLQVYIHVQEGSLSISNMVRGTRTTGCRELTTLFK